MHHSKLLTLLRGLQPEEIRWFQKFLQSPFYNTNKKHLQLFDYIRKYYPDLDSPKLTKEMACKKLFPKEKFNVQKVRKAMHGLSLLVEEFLIVMRLKNNPYQKKRLLIAELGERNIYDFFKKETEQLLNTLEILPHRAAAVYWGIHDLNLKYYEHVETNKHTVGMEHLKIAIEHLDRYYLFQRQRLSYAVKEREKLFVHPIKVNSLEQTRNRLQDNPTFKIYQLFSKTLTSPEPEPIFLEIELLFKQAIQQIEKNNQLEIIQTLLNYWAGQVNKSRKECVVKIFALYQFGLEHQLIMQDQQISETTFSNIVTIGILANEFDWVEAFIVAYQKYLPKVNQADAICLAQSLLFFYKKEYAKTVQLLSYYSFSTPLHGLNAKTILLRTYFEQFLLDDSYYGLLISQIQAFEKFIRRNTSISEAKKEIYLNFLSLTRKLLNGIVNDSITNEFLEKVKNTKRVVLKSWLFEKGAAVLQQ